MEPSLNPSSVKDQSKKKPWIFAALAFSVAISEGVLLLYNSHHKVLPIELLEVAVTSILIAFVIYFLYTAFTKGLAASGPGLGGVALTAGVLVLISFFAGNTTQRADRADRMAQALLKSPRVNCKIINNFQSRFSNDLEASRLEQINQLKEKLCR
jgi:hypothetical protein